MSASKIKTQGEWKSVFQARQYNDILGIICNNQIDAYEYQSQHTENAMQEE